MVVQAFNDVPFIDYHKFQICFVYVNIRNLERIMISVDGLFLSLFVNDYFVHH